MRPRLLAEPPAAWSLRGDAGRIVERREWNAALPPYRLWGWITFQEL